MWRLQAWDIRTAFLQASTKDDPDQTVSEIDGLWVSLPKWFPQKYNASGKCLKIAKGKTLYGMASAPRRWYFTLRKVMLEAGFETSKSDDCLFILRGEDGVAKGFAGWHVDDGLLTGDADFWKVMNEVVAKKLEFGKHAEKDFKFCGMQVTQDKDGSIRLNQQDQTKHLEEIPFDKKRSKLDPCTPEEITKIRGRVGAILYITGMTRPFEAYRVSHIASWATKACVYHLQLVNELVRDIRDKNPELAIEYKGGCSVDYMYTFHDSSFKQERESGSQMGILTFVGPEINSAGEIKGASLVRWASKRARRVCHSTLAAETLAATAGLDSQAGLQFRMEEFGFYPKSIL